MKLRTRILIDTKELIEDPHLWGQGNMESAHTTPRRCLGGAICAATGTPEHEISEKPITAEVLSFLSLCIQSRPDAQGKLEAFMTAEDMAHCPPSATDWLCAFNDHSTHETVIGFLDEAIAQSEPCEECDTELEAEAYHLLTIEDEPERILCPSCSLMHDHHHDDYRFPTSEEAAR